MNSLDANHFQQALPVNVGARIAQTARINTTIEAEVKRVLICRPNHRLGNLLLITPLLQEVANTFPACKIDLFVRGELAPKLFKHYNHVDKIIQLPKRPFPHLARYIGSWLSIMKRQYDMVINVDKGSSSGKLSLQIANSKHKVSGDIFKNLRSKFNDYDHHAKFPIYNFRNYVRGHGLKRRESAMPALDLKLSPSEIAEGRMLLNQLVASDRKTICLFTYATGNKCYSELWWENFYERLKTEFPGFNIIEVLPVQNVSKLSFRAPTFYSKEIREIGSLIANTDVFIGADSGIMHLANAVQTPTIGLFSVSNRNLYAPYDNNSVAINTNLSNTDECMRIINDILHYRFIHQPDLKIVG
jgi:ADP-heptose:LPS heptosyltransferase